jgi:REP element-mobilizing transposase RayT
MTEQANRAKHAQNRRRRSPRLPDYDYSQPGVYFVTICVWKRTNLLGEIKHDGVLLNAAGRMVGDVWSNLPQRFPFVALDAFVIMPDHLHGIIIIQEQSDLSMQKPAMAQRVCRTSLTEAVGAFKSISTREYMRGVRDHGWPQFERRLWQRSFHDRILRSQQGLDAVRQYIRSNPHRHP